MAYEDLKAAIKQAIKQNNNQEITGNLLQATLLSIVDNLGNNKAEKSDVTAELAKKFDKANVVQETGNATEKVISQKVITSVINSIKTAINDKLSKSEGGEVNKPIVITNKDSNYTITINPDASIYVWDKTLNKNIFAVEIQTPSSTINANGNPLSIHNIRDLNSRHGEIYNAEYNPGTGRYEDIFYANFFKRRNGTGKGILLDDGTTTSHLIKRLDITNHNNNGFVLTSTLFDGTLVSTVSFDGATKKLAGLMTAVDKAKLDNIPNIYAEKDEALKNIEISQATEDDFDEGVTLLMHYAKPGVAGRMAVIDNATTTKDGCMSHEDKNKLDNIENTYISSQNRNIYSIYDTNNGNTTLNVTGNYDEEGSGGRIALKRTEDGKGKLSIMLDGSEGSVNAETFKAIANPNGNEVWCTNGSRLNVLNLLSNAAIYVAGGFDLVGITNSTTVIDNPDSIIFGRSGRFFAKKDSIYYTRWNANISKNIAPPSRYGIETDTGVFPFNNQLYKFSESNSLYTATCSNGSCTMTELTL